MISLVSLYRIFFIWCGTFQGKKVDSFLHVSANLLALIYARFVHDPEDRLLYGIHRDRELFCDLFVGKTEGGKSADLPLADRESLGYVSRKK